MIRAKAVFAYLAIDHAIVKLIDVSRSLPGERMHDNRGIESNDVVAQLDRIAPPRVFDVAFQHRTERAIVVEASYAAIDLAGLENKTAALRQRRDVFHTYRFFFDCFGFHKPLEVWEGAPPVLLECRYERPRHVTRPVECCKVEFRKMASIAATPAGKYTPLPRGNRALRIPASAAVIVAAMRASIRSALRKSRLHIARTASNSGKGESAASMTVPNIAATGASCAATYKFLLKPFQISGNDRYIRVDTKSAAPAKRERKRKSRLIRRANS